MGKKFIYYKIIIKLYKFSLKVEEKVNNMKKMISILMVLIIGILVLSGFGVAAINNLTMMDDNQSPEKPIITGPLVAPPGTHEWTFEATDPDGDNVFYEIDWGDGKIEGWLGPYTSGDKITRNHTYPTRKLIVIKARAKDTQDAIGDWGYIMVEFSKSNQIINHFIPQFFGRFINILLKL